MENGKCVWILDPQWNKSITLPIPSVSINGVPQPLQAWSIEYKPLLAPDFAPPMPGFDSNSANTVDDSPLASPPLPIWANGTNDAAWQTYWESMARYIWSRVMLEKP